MYFETLKVYCDVVRHQSFSRGAKANDISQSAASQAVHQLEARLGVQLIDRSKRPWVLTPDGKYFFEGCQDILSRFEALEAGVQGRRAVTEGKVRVAAIYSVGLQDMSQYVEQFRQGVRGCEVAIEYMHPAKVCESIRSDQADLGLIAYARAGRDFTLVPWRQEEMVFACLPGHRLGRRRALRPQELEDEPFISFQKDLQIRRALDRFLREHSVQVRIVAEFDNVANIKQAVEDGVGTAILPEPTLRRDVDRGALAAVPFSGTKFYRPLSIIRRRKRPLSWGAQRFLELLCATSGASLAGPGRPERGAGEPRRVGSRVRRTG